MKSNTIASILQDHFQEAADEYGPYPRHVYSVVNAIIACKSGALGVHTTSCGECGEPVSHENSCRNRHCPQCQSYKAAQWSEKQLHKALPVGYFHAVFTLPSQLRALVSANRTQLYSLLFACVRDTIVTLSRDPKRLGALSGFMAVLHTWTRQMHYHPHVHCVIPAGGLRLDKKRWKYGSEKYLFAVPVMRELFKQKFLAGLRELLKKDELRLVGVWENSENKENLLRSLYKRKWVVYVKKPFATPAHLIAYLSLYTHRIAISCSRIVSYDGSEVTIAYTDTATGKRMQKRMSGVEFVRRFVMHILPPRFVKIRFYGFMASANRSLLKRVQTALEKRIIDGARSRSMLATIAIHETHRQLWMLCDQCQEKIKKEMSIREQMPPG